MLGMGLISGGVSLISGLLGRSSAKKQAAKEEAAIREANNAASENAAKMNKEARARAEAAALVPVQTQSAHDEVRTSATDTTSGGFSKSKGFTQGSVDMKGFMAAAEENGFNPLTFLRSGALALFGRTDSEDSETHGDVSRSVVADTLSTDDFTCTTGERAMDAAQAGQYIPQLSPVVASTKVPGMGDVLGNALTAGTNQYLSDRTRQEQNDFEMAKLNAQLAGVNRPGSYSGSRTGYVPSAYQYGSTGAGPGGSTGAGFKNPGDNLMLGGMAWGTDPNTSNADAYTSRYGESEVLEFLVGSGILAADAAHNANLHPVDSVVNMNKGIVDSAKRGWEILKDAAGREYVRIPKPAGSNAQSPW